MLEKNSKNLYFDAHFHIFDCISSNSFRPSENIVGCSSAHSKKEFEIQKKYGQFVQSYGIHPQQAGQIDKNSSLDFLENLLRLQEISAIGETGFDFFTENFRHFSNLQEELFVNQIELAITYGKPVIIHCRKANEKLFQHCNRLKKLPSVLFHSFMGTSIEAKSLIKKGLNCYFSFGKQIYNGNKKVMDCVTNIPLQNLLLETDAPFQFLKNEDKTFSDEIIKIYDRAFSLRKSNSENKKSHEEFCIQLQQNFHGLYPDFNCN